MSDVYELVVSVDLRDEISERELAELRWHLGLGGRPERLSVVTRFPVVVWDDEGHPAIEDDPCPLLAGRGAAARVGGVLCSALESRAGLPRTGWALTSRQEVHPDEFEKLGELLRWLAARAHATHLRGDGAVGVGFLRFHEAEVPEVLTIEGGQVGWPE
ncbi:hypothetical protein ACFQ8S_37250 [Streptomyces virginiae]|uniref:hypothetical protein n=1 Tax=Streptomyces virginiae TaxID=1961 RepID=UPI003673D3D4